MGVGGLKRHLTPSTASRRAWVLGSLPARCRLSDTPQAALLPCQTAIVHDDVDMERFKDVPRDTVVCLM